VGELIAVLSGKGGTGKTSVTAGLATALADMGHRVLCIDCDIGLRNLDISLGLAQAGTVSFLEVCRGEYTLEQAVRHPQYENLRFLTAPVNCAAEDIDQAAFSSMLREARQQFSYVFLDAPAGIDLGFRLCASHADRVILVTCPEPAAVRDAGRAGEVLELMGKPDVRLVVNRVSKKMFEIMDVTVDDVMDSAGLPLLDIVPEDANVTLAAAFESPLLRYTKRGAAAACRRIAKRILGLPEPVKI
jgi:septum site-determining protein MinD